MQPARHVGGAFESTGPAVSYTDLAGAYMDLDAGGTFAQFGAKGPGSIGLKLRTVLAGVALTFMTATAAGAVTFAENVSMSSGKTLAAQALTATTIVASSTASAAGFSANATGQVFGSTGSTTAEKYLRFASTGGNAYFGVNDSVAAFFPGLGAYSTVIYSPSNTVAIHHNGLTTVFSSSGVTFGGSNAFAIGAVAGQNRIQWDGSTNFTLLNSGGGTAGLTVAGISQTGGTASLQAITGTTITLSSTVTAAGIVMSGVAGGAHSGSAFHWYGNNVVTWIAYMNADDTTLRFRDQLNGITHVGFLTAATAGEARMNVAVPMLLDAVTPTGTRQNGEVWYDGTHIYCRIGGADKQLDN